MGLNASVIRLAALLLGCSELVAGAPSQAQDNAGPIVTVTGGQVQGRILSAPDGAAFKGIPYAAPPVGELRWRETQPVKPWQGVRQAAEYGPGCPAVNAANGRSSAEDCLYLNVWTPSWPVAAGKKLPVIFWINGGELYGGSASLRPGSESLTRHGVILVSANYRGQLFGIPGYPELTAESPHHASGNYMFYDEVAALKWVHANIARFGGDPGNVTLFGQSGGAHFISMFLTSPLAKGLVQRAIVDSDSVADIRPYLSLHELEQIGVAMAQALNAPSSGALAYLRSLTTEQISASMADVRKRLTQMNFAAYDEGIDGHTIPENPAEVYRSHRELAVPLIVGNTAHDTGVVNAAYPGVEYSKVDGRLISKIPSSHEGEIAWVKSVLEILYKKYPDLLDKAMQAYGVEGPARENLNYPPYGTLIAQVGSDLNHRCGTRTTAIWHSAVAPTWEFEFSRSIPGPANHGAELKYVFGTLTKDDLADPYAVKVRDAMQTYWTNFAKSGDPNGAGFPAWPKYNPANPQSIEFTDSGPIVKTANRAVACAPYVDLMNREPHPLLGGDAQMVRPGNMGATSD
jgi:para-nitrobenzyl esterase